MYFKWAIGPGGPLSLFLALNFLLKFSKNKNALDERSDFFCKIIEHIKINLCIFNTKSAMAQIKADGVQKGQK